ncbi:MAG: DUF1080 domain-containing protein [bacterium]|nr:DUF1080 domain-containing protein [bacterium]
MRRRLPIILLALVAIVEGAILGVYHFWPQDPAPVGTPTPRPEGDGWVDLLDAEHAPGWKNVTDDKDIFELSDGGLHVFGRTVLPLRYVGFATESFGDFDLHLEFKLAGGANSGLFLRAHPEEPVNRGFEVQVLDSYGEQPTKNSCGAIYDVVTPMFNMARPAGEWNSYDISVDGSEVVVVMNGWKVIDTDFAKMTERLGKFEAPYAEMPAQGNLLLQDHGGEVWYRNILIRPRTEDGNGS